MEHRLASSFHAHRLLGVGGFKFLMASMILHLKRHLFSSPQSRWFSSWAGSSGLLGRYSLSLNFPLCVFRNDCHVVLTVQLFGQTEEILISSTLRTVPSVAHTAKAKFSPYSPASYLFHRSMWVFAPYKFVHNATKISTSCFIPCTEGSPHRSCRKQAVLISETTVDFCGFFFSMVLASRLRVVHPWPLAFWHCAAHSHLYQRLGRRSKWN